MDEAWRGQVYLEMIIPSRFPTSSGGCEVGFG